MHHLWAGWLAAITCIILYPRFILKQWDPDRRIVNNTHWLCGLLLRLHRCAFINIIILKKKKNTRIPIMYISIIPIRNNLECPSPRICIVNKIYNIEFYEKNNVGDTKSIFIGRYI